MKKFITLMLIAFIAMFGFVSCTDYHVTIDNLPTEDVPTEKDILFEQYTTGISWTNLMIGVGTLINGTDVAGMSIDSTTIPLTPVVNDDTASLHLIVNLTDYDYDGSTGHNLANGTVDITYVGEVNKTGDLITAKVLDVDFDITFSIEDNYNVMNTEALQVFYTGTANIKSINEDVKTSVALTITNGVVSNLTGASLVTLTFPDGQLAY